MKRNQAGFTLVEIAIVLVIIGLLLGGILKGQEMITQAKIKNVIADFSGVSAAYHGYQDRYRAIPGDDPGAAKRWTTPAAATAGDGNGQLNGTYNQTCGTSATEEVCHFWDHLRRAGFVSGTGLQQPFNAVTGLIGVQTGGLGFSGLVICSANLPDKIAIAVDTQMDDGTPSAGTVRGITQSGTNPNIATNSAASDAASAFVESGTNSYTLCRSL
ncbi:MAG TPA: prepilin-type N-terminal cleavage/methylation domain-containing protein [Burkholderiales bacterium]|jgi:prepilin-type N-terminal cleavage/methylation domain-containing protein|nr:prepilin-type N-terminal cleavage/methylation domain-containing protein [Burkholderiales bacterium]